MTTLKKPKSTNAATITMSLTAHTAKTAVRILTRKTERKIEDVLGEDQFGLEDEKSKCSWDAENNNRTNFGNRRGNAYLLHRLAEGI